MDPTNGDLLSELPTQNENFARAALSFLLAPQEMKDQITRQMVRDYPSLNSQMEQSGRAALPSPSLDDSQENLTKESKSSSEDAVTAISPSPPPTDKSLKSRSPEEEAKLDSFIQLESTKASDTLSHLWQSSRNGASVLVYPSSLAAVSKIPADDFLQSTQSRKNPSEALDTSSYAIGEKKKKKQKLHHHQDLKQSAKQLFADNILNDSQKGICIDGNIASSSDDRLNKEPLSETRSPMTKQRSEQSQSRAHASMIVSLQSDTRAYKESIGASCEDSLDGGDFNQNFCFAHQELGKHYSGAIFFPVSGSQIRMPCPARNMGSDHNNETAFFIIPNDPIEAHGMELEISHDKCRRSRKLGRNTFKYCSYCKKPAAKRNFNKRHDHGHHLRLNITHKENYACIDNQESNYNAPSASKNTNIQDWTFSEGMTKRRDQWAGNDEKSFGGGNTPPSQASSRSRKYYYNPNHPTHPYLIPGPGGVLVAASEHECQSWATLDERCVSAPSISKNANHESS